MSSTDTDDKRPEIVIVRRGGNDDDHGHHGGVWKIAFADFMTAMMCLFLVMWLMNATDDQAKASIASYFNPMTLVDSAPSSKGLGEPDEATPARDEVSQEAEKASSEPLDTFDDKSGPANHENSKDHAETEMTSDEHLFSDPYAVLAEIAAQTAVLQNISAKGDGGAQTSGPATGAQGGESYRDPFAPDFWSQEIARDDEDGELDVFRQRSGNAEPTEATDETLEENGARVAADDDLLLNEPAGSGEDVTPPASGEPAADTAEEETQELAEQIRKEVTEAFGRDSELNKAISVVARGENILISVTDELNYGMFEIGSAVPKGELVMAMERIAKTLEEHPGKIRINGHTDARPFRNASYDNWRLSTARAHSAYYMLVRGGMDESRVSEVAGFADRALKDPENPLSDVNRRIEILLEAGG